MLRVFTADRQECCREPILIYCRMPPGKLQTHIQFPRDLTTLQSVQNMRHFMIPAAPNTFQLQTQKPWTLAPCWHGLKASFPLSNQHTLWRKLSNVRRE